MNTVRAPRRSADRLPEVAPAPRPRHLRVVRPDERPRRRRSAVAAIVVALAAVFLALFGLVVFHTVLVQSQSQLDDLDERVVEEQNRTEGLRNDITRLESPERILAEADLAGLIEPEHVVPIQGPVAPDEGPPPGPVAADAPTGDAELAEGTEGAGSAP